MLNHNAEIPPYYQEMPCSSNIAIIFNLNTFCWYSCMYSNLSSQSANCQTKQTLAGSSGSVRYDSLSSGTYIFRIVAKAANGERDIDRRKIHIGMYDCMAVFSNPPGCQIALQQTILKCFLTQTFYVQQCTHTGES